jgi:hypothetical protein
MWKRAIPFALVVTFAPAAAQTPAGNSGLHFLREPYAIEAFGAFRMLILEGDFSPKVPLDAVMAKRPTTGVGALAEGAAKSPFMMAI